MRVIGVFMAAATALVAFDAQAETPAERAFHEAIALKDEGRTDEACAKFRSSMDLSPSVGALLNVARCSEGEGKFATADAQYRALLVLNESTSDKERRRKIEASVRKALAALLPKIASLNLSVTPSPERLEVLVDGVGFDRLRLGSRQNMDPGRHVIEVRANGFVDAAVTVVLSAGEHKTVPMELEPVAGSSSNQSDGRRIPGWILFGSGGALLALGGGLLGGAFVAASEIDKLCGENAEPPQCDGSATDAAEATSTSERGLALQVSGLVGLGIGGALAITGLTLALTADELVEVAPAGPGASAGATLTLRF